MHRQSHPDHHHNERTYCQTVTLTSCSNWDRSLASTYGKNWMDFAPILRVSKASVL